jgi:hypothetical protein
MASGASHHLGTARVPITKSTLTFFPNSERENPVTRQFLCSTLGPMLPVATADSEQLLEITAYNRTEEFVARFFGVDSETIRGWRKRGQGPKYKKINGKLIRYSLADLTAWAESQPGGRGPIA